MGELMVWTVTNRTRSTRVAKHVLTTMAVLANDETHVCHASIADLCRHTGWGMTLVKHMLESLERSGEIRPVEGGYRLTPGGRK